VGTGGRYWSRLRGDCTSLLKYANEIPFPVPSTDMGRWYGSEVEFQGRRRPLGIEEGIHHDFLLLLLLSLPYSSTCSNLDKSLPSRQKEGWCIKES